MALQSYICLQERMAEPPNTLNIIIKRLCQQFRNHHAPKSHHDGATTMNLRRIVAEPPDDGTGASTRLGNAWLKIFASSSNGTEDKEGGGVPLGGAIRTRGNSWHPFSFKEGVLDMESTENETKKELIENIELDLAR